MREGAEGGGGGGPLADMEYVPSNLEVDSGFSKNIWTGSPVWSPPAKSDEDFSDSASAIVEKRATTDTGPSTVVTSCYGATSQAVELSITYSDLTVESDGSIPWLGLAFRANEECLMTPRGGGDTEVALLLADEFDALSPLHFMLGPDTKGIGMAAGRSAFNFVPLEDREEYANVRVTHSSSKDSVTLKFNKAMNSIPDVMHLMYAVGSLSDFGYHSIRTCFAVEEFPVCAGDGSSIGAAPSFNKDSSAAAGGSSHQYSVVFGAALSAVFAFGYRSVPV